ncbi:CpaF family protein, partial [Dactylosporangium sp. NPDC051485]
MTAVANGRSPFGWQTDDQQALVRRLRQQVAEQLAESGERLSGADRDARIEQLVAAALNEHARAELAAGRMPLAPPAEAQVAQAVRDALTGLGGLQPLLADPTITNILVQGPVVWCRHTDGSKTRMPAITASAEEL